MLVHKLMTWYVVFYDAMLDILFKYISFGSTHGGYHIEQISFPLYVVYSRDNKLRIVIKFSATRLSQDIKDYRVL